MITKVVHMLGETMQEVVLHYKDISRQHSTILRDLGIEPKKYLLATVHRAENTDDPEKLHNILTAFAEIEEPIIFPVQPRTLEKIEELRLVDGAHANPRYIDPVGYLDMLMLEQHARLILTDSGGMQKEAFWLGVPCITLREETEWVETVEAGGNVLVGVDKERIKKSVGSVSSSNLKGHFDGAEKASPTIVFKLVHKV